MHLDHPIGPTLFNDLPNARHDSGAYAWIHTRSYNGSPSSGDFVDFVPIDDRRCAIVVGDVAGCGVRPSAAARSLRTCVRTSLLLGNGALAALKSADRFFSRYVVGSDIAFASLFLALLDVQNQSLTYASAGHETALLYASPARHVHLSQTGPLIGLGLEPGACGDFAERAIMIGAHSTLVIATDGITDARSPVDSSAFFGSSGVVSAIATARAEGYDPARAVYAAAAAHAEGDLRDDASIVVAQLEALGVLARGERFS